MPHKFNAKHRDKFSKSKYQVTNWSKYNEGLRRRGDITIWFDKDIVGLWSASPSGSRGRPAKYSDLAIETSLKLRTVFGLPLRQTQGFLRALTKLMELDIDVPDFSTLSRRAGGLKLSKPQSRPRKEPLHLVIDSTGLKVFGAGEWQETKHGTAVKRRSWSW